MDFPFGHGHHHNRRHGDDDEQRFPPPPGYDGTRPPRPGYGGDDEQRFHPPPGYGGPPPPRPGYGGDDEQRFPPPPGYGRPPPSRPGYGGDDSYSYAPPPVQHTSHEYVPSHPLPVEDFYDEPPPSNYPPPGEFGGYGREEPSHHRPHGGDRPFSSSNPAGRAGHGSLGGGEVERQPTVRIFTKAKEDYAVAARDGKVVLVPSNPRDEYQHWIKDLRYSTKVKDQEGFPSFALVNKATGEAIKHSLGASHPVRLVPYQPDYLDESVLWTESGDTGEGFRCIRMVNNIDLNFDAWHGDEDHGGVHEGTPVVLWKWLKGKNQRWRIVPYCKFSQVS